MRAISSEQRNSVIADLNRGETVREVARRLGISPATVPLIGKDKCSAIILNKGFNPARCHLQTSGNV